MDDPLPPQPEETLGAPPPHRRRKRYAGAYPRRFEDKYKEHNATADPATLAKVIASGKTPAGTHRPIMVNEILQLLAPQPGEIAVDCTLGFGGHTEAILRLLRPGGRLLALDVDPLELPKTEARLRALGFGENEFSATLSNYAGLAALLAKNQLNGADLILADLGVSSMQLDNPARGFSYKVSGPLDLRMNPNRGQPAAALLARITPAELRRILEENADETKAAELSLALAGKHFETTTDLVRAVQKALPGAKDACELATRRVFQALRIAVNDEFSALDHLLRVLPQCLNPGGRAAILTFHSGEDGRVKRAFRNGLASGTYAAVSDEVIRPGPEERRANPRSVSAKLRWAAKAALESAGPLPESGHVGE